MSLLATHTGQHGNENTRKISVAYCVHVWMNDVVVLPKHKMFKWSIGFETTYLDTTLEKFNWGSNSVA